MESSPSQQEPFLMPGPQFNQNQNSSWFNRHSQKLILGIIVVLIALGIFSFYKSYQNRQTLIETALQGATSSPAFVSETPSGTPIGSSPAIKISEKTPQPANPKIIKTNPAVISSNSQKESPASLSSIPEVKFAKGQFTATAAQGNGATHLARYALKEYLKDKNYRLGAEQKIFIEDYLRKQVSYPKTLRPGDTLSFSEDLMKEAIAKAQALSSAQIQNLSQYVPLVPSI